MAVVLDGMSASTPSRDPYACLVPDDQLALLPPLPKTPRVDIFPNRSSAADTSRVDMTAFFASMEPYDPNAEDLAGPTPAIIEEHQHSSPMKRSESSTVFAGRSLARTPYSRSLATESSSLGEREAKESSSQAQKGLGMGRPGASAERAVSGGMKRSGSLHGLSEYPVFSTRQGGMNTPRNMTPAQSLFPLPPSTVEAVPPVRETSPNKRSAKRSPAKRAQPGVRDMFSPPRRPIDPAAIPLPETPAIPKQQLVPDSHASAVSVASSSRNTSASFLLPAGVREESMIGDCRPPTSMGFGREEESFDFDIEQIRPLTNRKARLGRQEEDEAREEMLASPSKQTLANPAIRRLNESTLLPSSPRADLLASKYAISRVAPPWADVASASTSGTNDIGESARVYAAAPVPAPRRSPRKALQTAPKTKRTFPASSSDQSLATVGEHDFLQIPSSALDKSTILPVSPAKQAHLLGREHMLLDEGMSLVANEEGQTFYIPVQASTEDIPPVPLLDRAMVATSSRTTKTRTSPLKTVQSRDAVWDKTLDLKELMANAKKPKRASGTEESFADLLNGEPELDGMNDFDPDETFLPATLRSMPRSTGIVPRSRSSHALQANTASPDKAGHIFDSARRSRRRSKSLSETDPKPVAIAADIPYTKRKTPAKMPPPPAPIVARQRQSMLPPLANSRRISLSAGAAPLTTSASVKRVELPSVRAPATRIAATSRPSIAPPAIAGASAVSKRTSLAPIAAARRHSAVPTSAVAPRVTGPTAARPRTGSATATSTVPARTSFQPRSKSISETVTTSASQPRLAPTVRGTTTSQLSSRTTATTTRLAPAGPSSAAGTGLTRPSTRVAGLPQPARDGTARSAIARPSTTSTTAASRQFGAEAGRTINRPSRTFALPSASTASSALSRTGPSSKLSAGPTASPSKREAVSSIVAQVRSLSTPASALGRTTATARTAGVGATSGLPARKSSVPPERTTESSRTTGLPRTTATASRLPAGGIPTARTGTLTRAGPAAARAATTTGSTRAIADIRAKLSQLEKRTTAVRR